MGRDGSVAWLCAPRFDSPPLFCALLDARRGGAFMVAPEGLVESRQYYVPETAVLVTETRTASGLVRLTDALALRGADITEDVAGGRGELVRFVEVLQGEAAVRVTLEPRGGMEVTPGAGGMRLYWSREPGLDLQLTSAPRLGSLPAAVELRQGEVLRLSLRWGRSVHRVHVEMDEVMSATVDAWRRWPEGA